MKKKSKSSLIRALCITTILLQIMVMFYSIIVALPPNPLSLNKSKTTIIQSYIPQSWGFFSKDPTEEELNVYSLEDDDKLVWPNNRIKNIFGLSRYGRAQGTEIGLLQSEIPLEKWTNCEDDPVSCLLNESKIHITNKTPKPTLCGDIGIAMETAVPWSWSKDADQINMPSKVVRMSVQCSKS